jgi:hypothetical protein
MYGASSSRTAGAIGSIQKTRDDDATRLGEGVGNLRGALGVRELWDCHDFRPTLAC